MHRNELEFAAIDRWNPSVNALIDWDRAGATARAGACVDGPLTGWSVAVKDIIDLEGLPTRCNADFVPAEPALKHAAIVDLLLAQGAFVAAKSVTTTFAHADPGSTRNPWNLDHTPGGSSSGSAAAVACGMVRLALGSQTVGSVNRPASFCGVVGFKPTYGRLPIDGVFPFSPSVDTVGFFASNVGDIQTVFAAVVNEPSAPRPQSPLRIGLIEDMGCTPADESMLGALSEVAAKLSDAGAEVQTVVLPDLAVKAYEHHMTVVAAEVARVHRDLFVEYGPSYTPKLKEIIEHGGQITESQLNAAQAHREETKIAFDRLFDRHDLLLCPAAFGPAPRGLESTGDPRMNLLWTHTGLPSLTLPASLADLRLPLGVQVVGPRAADHGLLAAGAVVEEVIHFEEGPRECV